MRLKGGILLLSTAILLLPGGNAHAVTAITSSVIGAGATGGSGATHEIASTLGQDVVTGSASATHVLEPGFWTILPAVATDVTGDMAVPVNFQLHQNVPNPFNPYTTIAYDVPAGGGWVRLRIYDIAGRLVRKLVEREETVGEKRVHWDGTTGAGTRVSTGVYFCVMEAPGYRMTRKVTLLR